NVTGSLLATDSSGSGEAYAIRAGAYDWRTYDWIDGGAVDDTVVLGDGANVVGKIDLGGGTNLLTLDGAGSMSGAVSNINAMTKSGAGIWSTDGDITANALSVLGGTLNVNVDPASTSTVRVATDLAVQDATLKVNGSQAATSMHVANDLTLQDGSLVVNGSQGAASTMEVARDLIARSSAVTVNGSQAGSSMRVTNDFTLQDGSLVVNGAQGTASALHVANDLTLRNSTVTVDGAQAAAASMHVANNLTVQDCELTVTGSQAATPTMRIANDFALQGGKMQVGISQTDTPTVLVTNTFTNNSEVTFVLDGLVESGKTFTVLSSGNLLGGGTYDIDSMLLSTSVVGSNVNVIKKSYLDILDTTDDNALALATALDSLTGTATGDMATILAELENAPSQKAFTSYLDELSGLFSSGTTAMSLGTAQQLSLATQTRMAQMRTYQTFMARNEYAPDPEDPESWPMVASNGDLAGVMFRGPESRPNGVHLRMLGRTGLMDTHGGYDGYDYRSMLISGGYDRVLRDGLLVGVSGGYARTDADYKDVGKSDSSLDSYSLGFYGTWFDEQWYVDAMISAAYNKYESNRQIPAFARIAKSDSTGYTVSAKNAGGYRFDVGGFGLTPNISVEYTRFHQNGYTESGAGAANLTLPDVDSNFLESGLGLKLDRAWQTGFGQIIPEISASWMHEWLTQDKSLTVSMTGMPGTVFSQTTAQTARDAYRFGAGVRLLHDKGMSLALNYQGEVEEHASSHSLMCEAQFVF
uniref:autotransporter family protein n=1 Tax=uncultured Pseudodesulfovibrio sp. TaxID=2035858 RepID=UPI0029C84D22